MEVHLRIVAGINEALVLVAPDDEIQEFWEKVFR